MLHIANFIFLFTIAFGIVALYISIQLYRENKSRHLRSNVYLLTGFNIIVFSNIIESYLKIALPDEILATVLLPYFDVILICLPLVLIYSTYHAAIFILGLLDKEMPQFLLKYFTGISGLFILSQIIHFVFSPVIFGLNLNYFSGLTVHIIFYFVWWFILIFLFIKSAKINCSNKRHVLQSYASIMLTIGILFFVITIAGVAAWISLNLQMLLLSITTLLFFLIPVLFMKRLLTPVKNDLNESVELEFDHLINLHKISKREVEIIKLLLQGMSNKEIARELFITPITVRDHLSKIYKKTNVRSRLQLANLFQKK